MPDDKEFNEIIESILEHGPPYDENERLILAIFGPSIPDWEGIAVPKLDVFKRYFRAVEVSRKLFGNSEAFEIVNHIPEPFQDFCGMSVYVNTDSTKLAYAGFFDEVSVKSARDLVSLVDTVTVDAEVSSTGKPILCLSWYINDPFLGKDS